MGPAFAVEFVLGFALGWSAERLIPEKDRTLRLALPVIWLSAALLLGGIALGLGVAVGFGWSWARAAANSVRQDGSRR